MYNSKIREICYAYAIANKMALPLSVEDSFNAVALWVEDTVTGMAPYIGSNNHWYVYDKTTQTYKDSGVQATGDKGDTGATPNIQINATVSQNTGTPSVNVEKSGTPENPLFKLVFDGIKGEQGLQGPQGPQGVAGNDALFFTKNVYVTQDIEVGEKLYGLSSNNLNRTATDGEVGFGVLKSATNNRSWYCTFTVSESRKSSFTATINSLVELTGKKGEQGLQGQQGLTALEYGNIITYASAPTTASITLAQADFNRDPLPRDSFIGMASATDTGTVYMCTFVVDSLSGTDAICHATNWRPIN